MAPKGAGVCVCIYKYVYTFVLVLLLLSGCPGGFLGFPIRQPPSKASVKNLKTPRWIYGGKPDSSRWKRRWIYGEHVGENVGGFSVDFWRPVFHL